MTCASLATDSELWKAIPGIEGYEASDYGRIRSIPHVVNCMNGQRQKHGGKILKPTIDDKDYLYVKIRVNGRRRNMSVHQLVLTAFIGPCPDGMEACHFPDRNPSNNRFDNLRWDTQTNNHHDKRIHGTNGAVAIQAGQTFWRLTAIRFDSYSRNSCEGYRLLWIFRCKCGTEKTLVASRVISGIVKSCGCLGTDVRKDSWRKRRTVRWISFNNRRMSLSDWERELNFPKGRLQSRLNAGWSIEKSITTSPRITSRTKLTRN